MRIALSVVCLIFAGSPAFAEQSDDFVDTQDIDRAVQSYTGHPVGARQGAIRPVDRRLRLAICKSGFAMDWYGKGRKTVKVECPEPGGWKIYVPIASAQSGTFAERAVPVVARGDMVSIAVRGPGFSVAHQGQAMEAGSIGDWIRVKLVGNREPLRARIDQPGQVSIPIS